MSILYQNKAYRRTIIISFLLVFWLTIIIIRLLQLQVFEHARWKEEVQGQNQDEVKILPKRGTIYDRRGDIMASNILRKSVYYCPSKGEPYELRIEKINTLKDVLGLSETEIRNIRERIKKNSPFIWIKRKIDQSLEERLGKLSLGGVYLVDENKRFYPHGKLAAHLLGRVNIDDEGLSGIEFRYNSILKGDKGEYLVMRDAKKREYLIEVLKEGKPGKDLSLTIDETIQYCAERELEKAIIKTEANWGTVIISNPSTGEILAMASYPACDLNGPPQNLTILERNKAVHYNFEPGSTFKIVTFAAAIEDGKISNQAIFDCSQGYIPIAGKYVRDHERFGVLTFPEVIVHSSNVGTIQISRSLSEDAFFRMIKAFGFGEKTGIDLPGEESGILRPLDGWTRSSLAFLSIGYEISVTPIQLLQAINIIANKGIVIPLRTVNKKPDFPKLPMETNVERQRVISEDTARKLTSMLERAVQEGTGISAQLKGYRVAGKTGTAQKIDPSTGNYSPTSHVASFVGFVSAPNPVLSMIVVIDEPKGRYYGGEVGAPVFRDIASHVLRYLEVPQQKDYLRNIRAENPWRRAER
jgi:cell division protein FtsI (penicillin-binding protein 3)